MKSKLSLDPTAECKRLEPALLLKIEQRHDREPNLDCYRSTVGARLGSRLDPLVVGSLRLMAREILVVARSACLITESRQRNAHAKQRTREFEFLAHSLSGISPTSKARCARFPTKISHSTEGRLRRAVPTVHPPPF